jgi:hypothetical protein
MPGAGVVWSILKTAATQVPWGRVVQNAPMVVDIVERVRERMGAVSHHGVADELRVLREENIRLADGLQKSNEQLLAVTKTLTVVAARQKLLAVLTVLSLLAAVAALALAAVK